MTAANERAKKNIVNDKASEKINEAKQQAHQEWNSAMKQLKTPGKSSAWNATAKRSYRCTGNTSPPEPCTLRNCKTP